LPARNTTVQLLTRLYTDPERHNPVIHSVTDGQTDRQTDGIMMPRADLHA